MRRIAAAILITFWTLPVAAHDLWLVPPEAAHTGKPATVRAVSGMEFPKGDQAPDPAKFKSRRLWLPDGKEVELAAAGKEGDAGLLRVEPASAGLYLVAVETEPKVIELRAEQFNEYLVSDGLPHIYRIRAKEGTLDKPARERYSKSPKALVRVGTAGPNYFDRVLGQPLEIVPLKDPFQLKTGDTLPVRVLFKARPLADANLGWDHPGDGEAASGTVRTDVKGEAHIPIAKLGLMTIRLTHMTRPKQADYEWESFWTTLTFRAG